MGGSFLLPARSLVLSCIFSLSASQTLSTRAVQVLHTWGTTSAAQRQTIDEFDASAPNQAAPAVVLNLPQVRDGSKFPCTASGSASSDGYGGLTLVSNYLTFGCYGAPVNTTSVTSSLQHRVIARVGFNGAIDTTSTMQYVGNWRGVASLDGYSAFVATDKNVLYVNELGYNASFYSCTPGIVNFRAPFMYQHPGTLEVGVYAVTTSTQIYYLGSWDEANDQYLNTSVLNLANPGSKLGMAWFSSPTTLWATDDVLGLYKWNAPPEAGASLVAMSLGMWTLAAGFPQRPTGVATVGLKALSGRFEDGSVYATIYATTYEPASKLARYREETNSWTTLYTAPAGTSLRAVFAAPGMGVPSYTSTPSGTPSRTPSASTTASVTSSVTSTASLSAAPTLGASTSATESSAATTTPTLSGSASITGTPTATATTSDTPTSSPTPSITQSPTLSFFTPGNVQVLHSLCGTCTASSASAYALEEFDRTAPNQAVARRTVVLPSGNATGANQPCTASGRANSDGYGSMCVDQHYIMFGCYGAPLGTPSVTSFKGPRVIARVDFDGVFDTSAWVDFDSNWRAVTSVDGESGFWAVTDKDVRYVATEGANASQVVLANTGNMRDVSILTHPITGEYSVWANTNGRAVDYMGTDTTAVVPGPFTPMQLNPLPSALGTVHFANHYTMFASDDSAGLLKYEVAPELRDGLLSGAAMAAVNWTLAAGFPQRATGFAVGLKALYGRLEGGFTVIYATTFATTGNALVRWAEETGSWSTLHVAPAGHLRAVFAADGYYTPSPSRSTTPSVTATGSTTPSMSATGSAASTSSPSRSATPSATATRSAASTPSPSRSAAVTPAGTRSPSATDSASVSASASYTSSVSNSASYTASVSATQSPTPSASESGTGSSSSSSTGTPSSSATSTGSVSLSSTRTPAATGTRSSTATRTGVAPTASSSKSRIVLPSRTSSATPTLTRSASRTATRTRSRPRASGTPTRTCTQKKKLRM